jgi:hypothetical protein
MLFIEVHEGDKMTDNRFDGNDDSACEKALELSKGEGIDRVYVYRQDSTLVTSYEKGNEVKYTTEYR